MEGADQIRTSFYRYVNNQADLTEAREFLLHLQSGKDKDLIVDLIEECLDSPVADHILQRPEIMAVLDETYEELLDLINPQHVKRSSRLWPWLVSAAAVVAIFGVGLFLYNSGKISSRSQTFQYANDIAPGGSKAILRLANGKTIHLSSAKKGVLIDAARMAYDDGTLLTESTGAGIQTIVMETPRGGQYETTLPDGTHIWLNAASKLKFPSKFTGDERVVQLSGEAYFEVAHNKDKPFKVKSYGQEVKVLGTHFNINTYTDEPTVKTTLLEGMIAINGKIILKPGEQASLNKIGDIKISPADENVIAWKNGKFRFHNASLETILRQFSRWYNVDVVYENGIPDEYYSGGIDRNLNLSQALDIFKTTNLNFKVRGKTLIISN